MIISEELHEWRLWIEPWYLSYALLGASVAGLTPILLPLAVSIKGNIAEVGIVIAAVNLGGLAAPLWGKLADRYRPPQADSLLRFFICCFRTCSISVCIIVY